MSRACLPPVPPPVMTDQWCYDRWESGLGISGDVFTDGSGRTLIAWPEANRAGWGFAVMQRHRCKGLAFGPLPGHEQSVPRAELYAIIQVLKHGILPLNI
eukprot:2745842-Pyramimonas_sp.AAC.1